MAHFAQIDYENIVTYVCVVDNDVLIDESGNESEALGIAYLQSIFGPSTRWVQTSYNANFRGIYAGIGTVYDPVKDIFFVPPPV